MVDTRTCPKCGAKVQIDHRFCGHCGHRMEMKSASANSVAIVRIHGGGADGARYELKPGSQTIGRESGQICFPDDPFVSPKHASLKLIDQQLIVEDLGSENGVFVRIKGPTEVRWAKKRWRSPTTQDDLRMYFGSSQPPTGLRRQILEAVFLAAALWRGAAW